MKKLLLFCVAACLSVVASAQKVYFLYLQSDDQTPFYVRMGDKIHSSASSGYLIIPNLTDSIYTFGLGFAKNNSAETKFTVTINQDDKGFVIKNFESGLALFDFRDLSIVKSNTVQTDNTVYETKSDNFSSVLSKAANDPSLLKVPVARKETPAVEKPAEKEVITAKVEEVKPAEQEKPVEAGKETQTEPTSQPQPEVAKITETKPDVAVVADTSTTRQVANDVITRETPAEPKSEPIVTVGESTFKRSLITRYAESSTTEGFGVVYFDKQDEKVDTIRILVPPSKVRLDEGAQTASLSEIEKNVNSMPTEARQLDTQVVEEKQETKAAQEQKTVTVAETTVAPTIASSCKEMASDKDFMKLRKKMAAENTDEEMIDEAKKIFRSKCFSVEQLRYLSTLFLTSAAKYQFFDASYNYASDRQNFSSLKAEIKDEYYLNRFKALVGE
ncbi:MAG TPA: DUF4476 domain-containing protein [Flavisolibacter sp.]|jgi:hypothetical protein|nr:DUF4476 domain-containing protein [Flavisolibacter sp.]